MWSGRDEEEKKEHCNNCYLVCCDQLLSAKLCTLTHLTTHDLLFAVYINPWLCVYLFLTWTESAAVALVSQKKKNIIFRIKITNRWPKPKITCMNGCTWFGLQEVHQFIYTSHQHPFIRLVFVCVTFLFYRWFCIPFKTYFKCINLQKLASKRKKIRLNCNCFIFL